MKHLAITRVINGTALDKTEGMLRDTLEMVPVALVLAIVLGFGAKPSRPTSTAYLAADSLTTSAHRIQEASAALSNRSRSTGHGQPVSSQSPLKAGQLENPRGASRNAGGTFLPRRSFDPSVPYFTSDDIRSFTTSAPGPNLRMRSPADPDARANHTPPIPERTSNSSADEASVAPRVSVQSNKEGLGEGGCDGWQQTRIDINKAGAEELARIPGIGRMRARILVESRPPHGYRTWAEIDMLPGFGPGTLGMLQRHGALGDRTGG